jgi:hypothetical protein
MPAAVILKQLCRAHTSKLLELWVLGGAGRAQTALTAT